MERVRSNLPVKGFLDDLASCQYTLLSALCELIDNSVQATRSNHEKREICIVMNTNHPDPSRRSVMVTDNGEGFDAAASEEFATLGMRGEISRAGDTLGEGISNAGTFKAFFSSILSRFGMGCKMAMNLIGDRYSLRSKTRGSLVVLEAAYDKFGDEYKYTERHIPCAPGDEDSSWSCIAVSGLQEGTTGVVHFLAVFGTHRFLCVPGGLVSLSFNCSSPQSVQRICTAFTCLMPFCVPFADSFVIVLRSCLHC
jgi:hypothetical protein